MDRHGELEFDLKLPEEAAELASDGDDAFAVAKTAGSEAAVAFAEALLHAPGEHFDFLGLAVLSLGKLGANFGFATVGLC